MIIPLDPLTVRNPALLECDVSGPAPATKLLIYTGLAFIPPFGTSTEDTLEAATVTLDLEALHSRRKFNPSTTDARASAAGLGGITGGEEAEHFTWAVDRVSTSIDSNDTLILEIAIVKQGAYADEGEFLKGGQIFFVPYQVTVRTAF